MENLTPEKIAEIKANADEFFEGDVDLAIAADIYGLWKVKKSAGMPVYADLQQIADVRAEYNQATGSQEEPPADDPPPANDPQPLEPIKTEFSDQDVFRCAYETSKANESDIRLSIARAMYGDIGVINGELNPLANANAVGQIKARYTRLMSQGANAPEEDTQPNAGQNAEVADEPKTPESNATEETPDNPPSNPVEEATEPEN